MIKGIMKTRKMTSKYEIMKNKGLIRRTIVKPLIIQNDRSFLQMLCRMYKTIEAQKKVNGYI